MVHLGDDRVEELKVKMRKNELRCSLLPQNNASLTCASVNAAGDNVARWLAHVERSIFVSNWQQQSRAKPCIGFDILRARRGFVLEEGTKHGWELSTFMYERAADQTTRNQSKRESESSFHFLNHQQTTSPKNLRPRELWRHPPKKCGTPSSLLAL